MASSAGLPSVESPRLREAAEAGTSPFVVRLCCIQTAAVPELLPRLPHRDPPSPPQPPLIVSLCLPTPVPLPCCHVPLAPRLFQLLLHSSLWRDRSVHCITQAGLHCVCSPKAGNTRCRAAGVQEASPACRSLLGPHLFDEAFDWGAAAGRKQGGHRGESSGGAQGELQAAPKAHQNDSRIVLLHKHDPPKARGPSCLPRGAQRVVRVANLQRALQAKQSAKPGRGRMGKAAGVSGAAPPGGPNSACRLQTHTHQPPRPPALSTCDRKAPAPSLVGRPCTCSTLPWQPTQPTQLPAPPLAAQWQQRPRRPTLGAPALQQQQQRLTPALPAALGRLALT